MLRRRLVKTAVFLAMVACSKDAPPSGDKATGDKMAPEKPAADKGAAATSAASSI
jgi:hypothetical protein